MGTDLRRRRRLVPLIAEAPCLDDQDPLSRQAAALQEEVDLLRRLCGEPLPSLDL